MSAEFNTGVVVEFRANKGRLGGALAGTPVILIHHVGATSGIERVTPLAYSTRGDGRLVIAASNGGSPTHPAWYHNLKAHPTIEVEVGTDTFTVLAEEVEGAARAELWPKLVAASPALGEFQTKTARRIPLFTLTPLTALTGSGSPSADSQEGSAARCVVIWERLCCQPMEVEICRT
jgi:deazaflavin-dependent oxidoreductase (nitroreductase family)